MNKLEKINRLLENAERLLTSGSTNGRLAEIISEASAKRKKRKTTKRKTTRRKTTKKRRR